MGYTTKRVKVRRYNRYIKQRAMVALAGVEITSSSAGYPGLEPSPLLYKLWIPGMPTVRRIFGTRGGAVRYAVEQLGIKA